MSSTRTSSVTIAALILAVSSPTFAGQPAKPRTQLSGYMTCLIQGVEELDDFVSDASTIARAVFPLCDPKRKNMVASFEAGRSQAEIAKVEADWSLNRQFEATIGMVLKNRALHRQNSN